MNGGILRVTGHDEDLAKKAAKSFVIEGNSLWSFSSNVSENWFVNCGLPSTATGSENVLTCEDQTRSSLQWTQYQKERHQQEL